MFIVEMLLMVILVASKEGVECIMTCCWLGG